MICRDRLLGRVVTRIFSERREKLCVCDVWRHSNEIQILLIHYTAYRLLHVRIRRFFFFSRRQKAEEKRNLLINEITERKKKKVWEFTGVGFMAFFCRKKIHRCEL